MWVGGSVTADCGGYDGAGDNGGGGISMLGTVYSISLLIAAGEVFRGVPQRSQYWLVNRFS
jgi:hypothetical protein